MTQAVCLPPRIDSVRAARFFSRPRFGNLFGLCQKPIKVAIPGDPGSREPPFIERVWLPAYAVRLNAPTRQKMVKAWVTIDGYSRECALFYCPEELALLEVAEEVFPPRIDDDAAGQLARSGILRVMMAQRKQIAAPRPSEIEEIRLYHFPIWVLYYRRFKKSIDLKVLDGYSGTICGPKMRISLIEAMVESKKAALRA